MKNKNLTNLIVSMIALLGIAYAGAQEVAYTPPEGKPFKKLAYGERMYNADEVDEIVANIPYFDPNAENVKLGRNAYGDYVVLFATGTDEKPASLKHGDPQCGNVTIGSAATNLNVCSVVIGKEAVGKNFGGSTIGFKARNDDSHSTAIGYGARIISTVTPTMFCAYSDGNNYVPPDFFRPNTGFMNTAINGYIKDSFAGTSIGNEFGWTANELHGLDVTGQSVVIGKLAYVGSDKTSTNEAEVAHCVTDSVAIGTAARVFADNGTAVGRQSTVKGAGAVAIGFGAQALADDTIVIGRGTATVPGQVVIGGHLMATMQDVDAVVAELRAENEALRTQLETIQTAAAMMLNSLNAESEPTTFAAGAAPAEKKEFTLEDFLQAIVK